MGAGASPVEYKPAALPRVVEGEPDLDDYPAICGDCLQPIRWGRTVNGNQAPFDVEPPHPNHWITCKERDRARQRHGRR